jgi:CRP/FNR family transcriptional regulator
MSTTPIRKLIAPIPKTAQSANPCAACSVRFLSICGVVEPQHLHRLDEIVTHKALGAGETLFIEGDRCESLYIITAGCVRLHKMLADGRRQITGFLFPSDFLGLALRERHAYTAEAVTEVRVCRYPKMRLEDLFNEFPAMERRLLAVASNDLAAAQDQMLLLGRKTALERVASFLHLLVTRLKRKDLPGDRLALPMTRTDIGDYLGLTIETVSRSLSRLKRDKVIRFASAQDVEIVSLDRLAELAGNEEDWDQP